MVWPFLDRWRSVPRLFSLFGCCEGLPPPSRPLQNPRGLGVSNRKKRTQARNARKTAEKPPGKLRKDTYCQLSCITSIYVYMYSGIQVLSSSQGCGVNYYNLSYITYPWRFVMYSIVGKEHQKTGWKRYKVVKTKNDGKTQKTGKNEKISKNAKNRTFEPWKRGKTL